MSALSKLPRWKMRALLATCLAQLEDENPELRTVFSGRPEARSARPGVGEVAEREHVRLAKKSSRRRDGSVSGRKCRL